MNEHPFTDSSAATSASPDAISRRAYELWENEGRPEGCELRHWLQAEQELRTSAAPAENRDAAAENQTGRNPGAPSRDSDVTPLQGTRAAAAAGAVSMGRDSKRPPTPTTVSNTRNGSAGAGARRKSTGTPPL